MKILPTVLTDITHLVEGHNDAKLGKSCVKKVKTLVFDFFFDFEYLEVLGWSICNEVQESS